MALHERKDSNIENMVMRDYCITEQTGLKIIFSVRQNPKYTFTKGECISLSHLCLVGYITAYIRKGKVGIVQVQRGRGWFD